jgi:hypothetical protein
MFHLGCQPSLRFVEYLLFHIVYSRVFADYVCLLSVFWMFSKCVLFAI